MMTPVVCNPFTGEFITLPEMKATLNGSTSYYGMILPTNNSKCYVSLLTLSPPGLMF